LATGIVLLDGDANSPVARAARRLAVPCVSVSGAYVDDGAGTLECGESMLREGEFVTIDGTAGLLYGGVMPIVDQPLPHGKLELHVWRVERLARRNLIGE
jgi:pyruvate, orthophosphate dikinase